MKQILSLLTVLWLAPFAAFPNDETNATKSAKGPGIPSNDDLVAVETNSLAGLADQIRPGFLLGSFAKGLESTQTEDSILKEFFRRNFNIMTIGLYMSRTQPKQGSYNFEAVDALVDYADANHETIYFHPLIGGALYTPKWVNEGNFTAEELRKIMRERIAMTLGRYRGKVGYVDVVNEALANTAIKPDGQVGVNLFL